MRRRAFSFFFALTTIALPSLAASINFDSLDDGDLVSNQFSGVGVTFQNAIVLGSGISLNEFEFPPRSNFNVISDNGGAISILFASPQSSVSAYFTYTEVVTMQAYDASSTSLGSVTSLAGCSSNLFLSGTAGCSPNEQLGLSGIGAISRVTITGNAAGGSFVLDDLNFDVTSTSSEVPEPSTLFLVTGGIAALAMRRLRNRQIR